MRGIRTIATTIVLAGMVYAATTAAQTHGSREAFFRCKDRNGQTHYGDSMPPECAGLDTEVLNERGMQVRLIEGEATRAKRLLTASTRVRTVSSLSAMRFCSAMDGSSIDHASMPLFVTWGIATP